MNSCVWIQTLFSLAVLSFYASVECNNNETDLEIVCPDGKKKCANDDTCCPSGLKYKCCPLLHAVCCNDGEHCCPENTVCDLKRRRCIGINLVPVNSIIPIVFESLIKKSDEAAANNICPNRLNFCSERETCCRTQNGNYKCCPYEFGTCCEDDLRCCPNRSICFGNTCVNEDKNVSVSTVNSFSAKRLNDITCNDGHHCEDNDTCCQLSTGNWGCCPLKNAVCCSDKIHCCPEGTICDTAESTCLKSTEKLP